MICKNCGADVRPDKFCSNCGSALSVRHCTNCGSPVSEGDERCSQCGKVLRDDTGGSGKPALKRRKEVSADKRTGFQSVICLLFGLASVALSAIVTYLLLLGDLFTVTLEDMSVIIDPLTMMPVVGDVSTGIINNAQAYVDYWPNTINTIMQAVGSAGENMMQTIGTVMVSYLPHIIFVFCLLLGALVSSLATLFGLFGFIGGLIGGRFFTMARSSSWSLFASLLVFIASVFAGMGGMLAPNSGVIVCVMLSAISVALCAFANILFAGRRFFKGGSILKFVSNAGIVAGAIVAFSAFPMIFATVGGSEEVTTTFNQSLVYLATMVSGNDFSMPTFALLAVILVISVKCLFSLPRFVRKTSLRLAKTFKFDGYEDTGYVGKSFFFLFGLLLIAVPAFVLVNGGYLGEGEWSVSPELVVFVIGGIIAFAAAIVNRVFLNSDQR